MASLAMDDESTGVKIIQRAADKLVGNMGDHLVSNTVDRNYKSCFGVSLSVTYMMWCWLDCNNEGPEGATIVHLLWSLLFLKTYGTYDQLAGVCKVHRDTYRKWVWLIITRMAFLDDVVSLNPNP